MDEKRVLREYIDACDLISEIEADLKKLEAKQKITITEKVAGSNPEYPYNPQHFNVSGAVYGYEDDIQLRREEKMLQEQKEHAERIKEQAEYIIHRAPVRIQRIIRMRYKEKMQWNAIAHKIGCGTNADSIRMELRRYLDGTERS